MKNEGPPESFTKFIRKVSFTFDREVQSKCISTVFGNRLYKHTFTISFNNLKNLLNSRRKLMVDSLMNTKYKLESKLIHVDSI